MNNLDLTLQMFFMIVSYFFKRQTDMQHTMT